MKKIKVLHLASFEGNIGDNANHSGSRSLLKKNLEFDLDYTDLEIREFYWKNKKFDDSFVGLANQHDLIMIGGGNYFELWVKDSHNGTSIDISIEQLERIKPPIVFYALGCDAGQGVPEENIQKFKRFLDYLNSNSKYLVSVRNDGSFDTVRTVIGLEYAKNIFRVPDGGFFTEPEDHFHPELPTSKKVVAINLAGDMPDQRFNANPPNPSRITYKEFLKVFGELINKLLRENDDLSFVFIPHIYKDIGIIADTLEQINDKFRRNRITTAPYLHGKGSQEYIFDLYRKCDLVWGTRFHANVCSIGMCVPTIGLINYPQIEKLYQEIDLVNRTIKINEHGFEDKLSELTLNSFRDLQGIKEKYYLVRSALFDEIEKFHMKLKSWMIENI